MFSAFTEINFDFWVTFILSSANAFYPSIDKINFSLQVTFFMLSAITFNLEKSEMLLFG